MPLSAEFYQGCIMVERTRINVCESNINKGNEIIGKLNDKIRDMTMIEIATSTLYDGANGLYSLANSFGGRQSNNRK